MKCSVKLGELVHAPLYVLSDALEADLWSAVTNKIGDLAFRRHVRSLHTALVISLISSIRHALQDELEERHSFQDALEERSR